MSSLDAIEIEIRLIPTRAGHVGVRLSSNGDEPSSPATLMHHPIQCAMPHLSIDFDWSVGQARQTRA